MSTPCHIWVKVKKESIGKYIKPLKSKLHKTCKWNRPLINITELKNNYIGIYVHWDGHIESVGKTLVQHYNDYDKILNLISCGDCTEILNKVLPYTAINNRIWECNKPTQITRKPTYQSYYTYLFDNGKWYVKTSSKGKWLNLEEKIIEIENSIY